MENRWGRRNISNNDGGRKLRQREVGKERGMVMIWAVYPACFL